MSDDAERKELDSHQAKNELQKLPTEGSSKNDGENQNEHSHRRRLRAKVTTADAVSQGWNKDAAGGT